MAINDYFNPLKWFSGNSETPSSESKKPVPLAFVDPSSIGTVWSYSYNGEKNLGELGPPKDYFMDYGILRVRSWQSFVESEITQIAINRFATWTVATGLKLQATPKLAVIGADGTKDFSADAAAKFATMSEARFHLFAESKAVSVNKEESLNQVSKSVFKYAKIGGDCLVILRLKKGKVEIRLIDSQNVETPLGRPINQKNRIRHGVEIDANGKHVAYWIKTYSKGYTLGKYERIPAYSKSTGLRVAFMVYGSKYRPDSVRGIPLLSTVLETLKKLERYKEATVGSAEERQKIVYQIIHGVNSTGESHLREAIVKSVNPTDDVPHTDDGEVLRNKVAATTNKTVVNNTPDSKLEVLESKNELYFKDFYDTNFDIVCAAVGIPPNVAKQRYDDNFSASRAALKDWENTLRVERKDFAEQFLNRVYEFWLFAEVLSGKVPAPGYVTAYMSKETDLMSAYSSCRWVGAQVPHIDPVKEVKAERLKLGNLFDNAPLSTLDASTERLDSGDSASNVAAFKKEYDRLVELGLIVPEEKQTPGGID
jgi:capsid protein